MQFSAVQLFLAAAAAQVITQIGDGQIQAPTFNSLTTISVPTTILSPVTLTSTPKPVTTTIARSVITQIGDGQIQAPTVQVSLIPSVYTPSPIVYTNTSTIVSTIRVTSTLTQPSSSAPVVVSSSSKATTPVAPVSSSAVVSSSSVRSSTTVAPVSSSAVSSSARPSTVVPQTGNGASLPTAAAGLLFLAGAAALL